MRQARRSTFEIRIGPAAIFVLALTLGLFAAPRAAEVQQQTQVARIGWVAIGLRWTATEGIGR